MVLVKLIVVEFIVLQVDMQVELLLTTAPGVHNPQSEADGVPKVEVVIPNGKEHVELH